MSNGYRCSTTTTSDWRVVVRPARRTERNRRPLPQAPGAGGSAHVPSTRRHDNRTGGNPEIRETAGRIIAGPRADRDRIRAINVEVDDGDRFMPGAARAYRRGLRSLAQWHTRAAPPVSRHRVQGPEIATVNGTRHRRRNRSGHRRNNPQPHDVPRLETRAARPHTAFRCRFLFMWPNVVIQGPLCRWKPSLFNVRLPDTLSRLAV